MTLTTRPPHLPDLSCLYCRYDSLQQYVNTYNCSFSALDCAVKGLNSSDIYSTSVTAYAAQLLKLKLDQGGLGGEYPQLNAQIGRL